MGLKLDSELKLANKYKIKARGFEHKQIVSYGKVKWGWKKKMELK